MIPVCLLVVDTPIIDILFRTIPRTRSIPTSIISIMIMLLLLLILPGIPSLSIK